MRILSEDFKQRIEFFQKLRAGEIYVLSEYFGTNVRSYCRQEQKTWTKIKKYGLDKIPNLLDILLKGLVGWKGKEKNENKNIRSN